MARLTYIYKDYCFEYEDNRVLLSEDEYLQFAESCRILIDRDRAHNKREREALISSKKS